MPQVETTKLCSLRNGYITQNCKKEKGDEEEITEITIQQRKVVLECCLSMISFVHGDKDEMNFVKYLLPIYQYKA